MVLNTAPTISSRGTQCPEIFWPFKVLERVECGQYVGYGTSMFINHPEKHWRGYICRCRGTPGVEDAFYKCNKYHGSSRSVFSSSLDIHI